MSVLHGAVTEGNSPGSSAGEGGGDKINGSVASSITKVGAADSTVGRVFEAWGPGCGTRLCWLEKANPKLASDVWFAKSFLYRCLVRSDLLPTSGPFLYSLGRLTNFSLRWAACLACFRGNHVGSRGSSPALTRRRHLPQVHHLSHFHQPHISGCRIQHHAASLSPRHLMCPGWKYQTMPVPVYSGGDTLLRQTSRVPGYSAFSRTAARHSCFEGN